MKRVHDFLKKAEVYYLATVEGDQPRVRPTGTKEKSLRALFSLVRYCMGVEKAVASRSGD